MTFFLPTLIQKKKSVSFHGQQAYQSSSSLQHSIPQVSFTQSQRFKEEREKEGGPNPLSYFLPSQRTKRATSFGYGKKQIISSSFLRNALLIPAPNYYHPQNPIHIPKEGSSFGKEGRISRESWMEGPGPGEYNIRGIIKPKGGKILERTKDTSLVKNYILLIEIT